VDSNFFRILLIEDSEADARLVKLALADVAEFRFDVVHVDRLSSALELDGNRFHAVLLDLSLPDSHGLSTLRQYSDEFPAVPVIVLSGQHDVAIAIEAVQAGAQDYLVKGVENSYFIARAIRYAIERKHSEEELRKARTELEHRVHERTEELLETNKKLREQIAEREHAERAQRESEHQVQLIADALPILISYLDKEKRYRFNNKAHGDWFRHSNDEIIGKQLAQTVGESIYEKIQSYTDQALSGTIAEFEIDFPHPEKGTRCLHVVFVPDEDEQGQVKGFYSLSQDITERKQSEERDRQRMLQLAHASRLTTTGQMATEIAHEINQPLTAIATYSDTCLRIMNSDPWDHDDLRNALQQIANQADRAGEVIRQLRSFARKDDSHRSTVSINKIVQEITTLIEVEARWYHIDVQLKLTDQLPTVLANKILIQQVVLNFVRNAIDAMIEIKNTSRRLTVTTAIDDQHNVAVTVQDTGPGLPASYVGQIFDPFYTTKADGVGMGLAISESIIKAHNGRIWVADHSDRGCTFAFSLPAYQEEPGV
jgi:PAS domain S-box-containing protein